MSQQPFALYNPALLPADHLLAEFTARRPLLETLLGIVQSNTAGHPPQHCLLIGARGMGKTTTLWAIAHRVNRDAELARLWQPVVFDEESRRVGDLADFWLESIRQWEHAVGDRTDRAGGLLTQGGAEIENRARQTFLDLVARSGRRALLLIDNLNDLFSSIHDVEPLHRLRAFLMEESRVMLVGGATRYFEEITNLDQPFFEFFRCFELRALSAAEMKESLFMLAETRGDAEVKASLEKSGGTLKALHLLTGGNPRLVKTFYRLLRDGLHGDVRADLEKLLDEFTPYFKAIVDALPVQQQRLFDAVALAWDPIEVGRISTATRLPSNQVSAQLRALVKLGLITEAAGSPKRKTYLLTDRFSNIHYLMRHGRTARNRLDWFVAMVRSVFPDTESANVLGRIVREAAECGPLGRNDAKYLLQSALDRAESLESRRDLLHATIRESWSSEALASLEGWFDTERAKQDLPELEIVQFCKAMPTAIRRQIDYKPGDAHWWYKLTNFLEEKEAWKLAETAYRKAIEISPEFAYVWNGLGNLLARDLVRPTEAEAAFRKAIELDPKFAHPWNGLGNVLSDHLGRPNEAEVAYRKAIELDPKFAYPWNGLGNVLKNDLKRPADAEAAYRRAIEIDPKLVHPWNGLGNVLSDHLGRPNEAEAAFRKAIELGPKWIYSWHGLGSVLRYHLGRPGEAEAAFRKAIELDPKWAYSWSGLGNAISDQLGRPAEAEAAYRKAIELDPKSAYPWNGLGNIFKYDLGRPVEAEAAYRKAIELDPKWSCPWYGLGNVFQDNLGRPIEAEAAYRKAIELDPKTAYARSALAEVLAKQAATVPEAHQCAVIALSLKPDCGFARYIFKKICADQADDWRQVLPALAEWCVTHRESKEVFQFTLDGFVTLAKLINPEAVLTILDSLKDASPFETLHDACIAHSNREHLHRLSPERQTIAVELMKKMGLV